MRIFVSFAFHGQSSDEFANIFLTREVFASGFKDFPELFMWFYYFISALLLFFVKDAFIATTFISISFSIASILVLYIIAKRISNSTIAFFSCILILLNPEYTLISSVPLREPVYTFFILISLLMLMQERTLIGALMIGMAFLTRMEGLLVAMPLYLLCIFIFFPRKNWLKILIPTLSIFILCIFFMNLFLSKPFQYLTGSLGLHLALQKPISTLSHISLMEILINFINSITKILKYLFNLIGPNLIFALPGFIVLWKNRENKKNGRKLILYFILPLLFWFCYIYIFGNIIYNFHRYFYTDIPLILLLIAIGFFNLFDIKRIRFLILIIFICGSISTYYFYYVNPGKQYFMISKANKNLIGASLWIDKNIGLDKKSKLLIDGVAGFYLFRKQYKHHIVRWDEYRGALAHNDPNSFFKFLRDENIKYVVWSNENLSALTIAPYLKGFKEINSTYGILIPIREWNRAPFVCNLFEFKRDQ